MESIATCEDLQTIRSHILLKDGEDEIQNQVRNSLLNLMYKAFAVTL